MTVVFRGDAGGSPILAAPQLYIFFTGVYMAVSITFLAASGEISRPSPAGELPLQSRRLVLS